MKIIKIFLQGKILIARLVYFTTAIKCLLKDTNNKRRHIYHTIYKKELDKYFNKIIYDNILNFDQSIKILKENTSDSRFLIYEKFFTKILLFNFNDLFKFVFIYINYIAIDS